MDERHEEHERHRDERERHPGPLVWRADPRERYLRVCQRPPGLLNEKSWYAAPGQVCMFTPSTPTRASANSVSTAHRADANVSLTPARPEHETEFISSSRRARPR